MSALAKLPPASGLETRRTTPDHVADLLREAILTGRLEDGEELNQVALAEYFRVSRVPVREALRQLQAEGLVRQEAHRRAVVSTLTPDHIAELFDLRVLLETYMLRRAMAKMDESVLSGIDALMARMAVMGESEHEAWLAANRDLHAALYAPSGAGYAQELTAQIAARSTRYLYLRSGGMGLHRQEQAHKEHEHIVASVRAGDEDAAAAALEAHINGTRRAVLAFLQERAQQTSGQE